MRTTRCLLGSSRQQHWVSEICDSSNVSGPHVYIRLSAKITDALLFCSIFQKAFVISMISHRPRDPDLAYRSKERFSRSIQGNSSVRCAATVATWPQNTVESTASQKVDSAHRRYFKLIEPASRLLVDAEAKESSQQEFSSPQTG